MFFIFKHLIMKLNILQIICLINYVGTFPNDLFDELWETNQSEPQANNNPIESQPKIKVEPLEEQLDGRWQDESALKRNLKVEHGPHFGAVNVEGTVKIKHELEWRGESDEFKEQLDDHVKEEVQDGQAPNTSDHKKIGDNSNKQHLSDQNESVDEQQNESNECEKIKSNQHKLEIIQKFRELKKDYTKNRKYSKNEWNQIEKKISNRLGVGRSTIYKWIKELGLSREKFSEFEKRQILKDFDEIKSKCKKAKLKSGSMNELDKNIAKKLGVSARAIYKWKHKFGLSISNKKFSELEKREILKQFYEIKSKCKKANLKNFSKNELEDKISKKLGVCAKTIYEWKRTFGLCVNKKFSDATKIGILKKYAKIKGKNPKMTNAVIADMLTISPRSLSNWKKQFKEEIKNF